MKRLLSDLDFQLATAEIAQIVLSVSTASHKFLGDADCGLFWISVPRMPPFTHLTIRTRELSHVILFPRSMYVRTCSVSIKPTPPWTLHPHYQLPLFGGTSDRHQRVQVGGYFLAPRGSTLGGRMNVVGVRTGSDLSVGV